MDIQRCLELPNTSRDPGMVVATNHGYPAVFGASKLRDPVMIVATTRGYPHLPIFQYSFRPESDVSHDRIPKTQCV